MNRDNGVLTQPMTWECSTTEQRDPDVNIFHICMPAHLSYVAVVRRALDALGDQFNLSPDDLSALKLAVGEACNNAVQYGNFTGVLETHPQTDIRHRSVGVKCRALPEAIEIDIVSQGERFEPLPGDYRMPSAESMSESGRGLALIELMMDSVKYLTEDGNHVVRMQKRLRASSKFDDHLAIETLQEP